MGYLSIVSSYLRSRSIREAILIALIATGAVLPLTTAEAQSRFGSRAGSRFVNPQGPVGKGPYRRRQTQNVRQNSDDVRPAFDQGDDGFDYRLDADNGSNDFVDGAELKQVGFCSGGCDCGCGDCVEASCGCDDTCCDDGCCGGYCEPSCGVSDGCCGTYGSCCPDYYPTFFAGFEWSFVKPRFSNNVAFTTLESNDTQDDRSFSDTEFDYDLELTPRVWLEGTFTNSWGWRVTYWQFDQSPATETVSPPANEFGEISTPDFGDVDLSSNLAANVYTFASDLNAYTIDVEATKYARVSRWQLGLAGGLRYASTEQGYFASLSDGNNEIESIDFTHELEGVGPTFSAYGSRPLVHRVNLICAARGSLLFGDGSSRLAAVEDDPFTTVRVTNREDILPIGEARVGLEWLSTKHPKGWQWMLTTAMEGQIWGNAGNASSETADLGFFGFNVGAGFLR